MFRIYTTINEATNHFKPQINEPTPSPSTLYPCLPTSWWNTLILIYETISNLTFQLRHAWCIPQWDWPRSISTPVFHHHEFMKHVTPSYTSPEDISMLFSYYQLSNLSPNAQDAVMLLAHIGLLPWNIFAWLLPPIRNFLTPPLFLWVDLPHTTFSVSMQPKTWWIQVIYARINDHQPSLKWNAHVMVLPDLIRCWDIYEYATNFDSYVTFETLAGCCYTLHQTIPMFIDALDATYYPAVSHIHQLLDTWVDDDKVPTIVTLQELPHTFDAYIQNHHSQYEADYSFYSCFNQGPT